MRRHYLFVLTALASFAAVLSVTASGQDIEQHLRDQYQGKTLLLRGFYSNDHLQYDSAGVLQQAGSIGDWTSDGFVLIRDFRISRDGFTVVGQRVAAVVEQKAFFLRPVSLTVKGNEQKPVLIEIEIDLAKDARIDQIDGVFSKIFLTDHDHLAELVPDYWKTCLTGAPAPKVATPCRFSSDFTAVPGLSPPETSAAPSALSSPVDFGSAVWHVGNGVSAPRVRQQKDPEFSERARQGKIHGTVLLGLIVSPEGLPKKINILSPVGAGLDAQAVLTVGQWRFAPAEKDGRPVAAEIAVEVDFHLY